MLPIPVAVFGVRRRAHHHPKMGNLLPLNMSIDESRTDTEKLGSGLKIYWSFNGLGVVMLECNT
jgi:hypothetical protein